MSRRRAAALPLPPDWEEREETTINGRTVEPGTELSIRGARGRFRFLKHVTRPERGLEWIECWGGPKGCETQRSFRPEQVRTVHRIKTTDKALMMARKGEKK